VIVELSARAESDFLAIVDNLSDYSAAAAHRFIDAFEDAREQLGRFPRSGHTAAGGPHRVLHIGVYLFRYTILEDRLVIRRIVDGRRQQP
jgi:plasmid stabilization system protein ParE